jgi:DNA polymerase-3 subunit alpha
MLVFNAAYAAAESQVAPDRRVLVRGRVDHKDRGETKLVVQEVEACEPSAEEIAAARNGSAPVAGTGAARRAIPSTTDVLVLKVDARHCGDALIGDLKSVLEHFPGQTEVLLEMETSAGLRRLRFGPDCRVSPSIGLRAELHDLLGADSLAA